MPSPHPAPERVSYFSDEEARALLVEHFGVDGTLQRLPGYSDQNYRVSTPEGAGWIFKIMPSEEPRERLEMQHEVLTRLSTTLTDPATPEPVLSVDGDAIAWASDPAGESHGLRLLTYLSGDLLATASPRSPQLLESLGRALARLHAALEGYEHAAAHQDAHEWDLTRAVDVVSAGLAAVADPARRAMLDRIVQQFESDAVGLLKSVPWGVIHGDINDHNLLISPPSRSQRSVTGILDFGDLLHGPMVADLAIAATYGCLGTGDPLGSCVPVVRGYVAARPISEAEAEALYPLIRARLATSVVHSARRSEFERQDPYLSVSEAPVWAAIEAFEQIHPRFARAVLRDAAGHEACPNSVEVVRWLEQNPDQCGPIVKPELGEEGSVVFDMSPGSLDVERLDRVLDAGTFTQDLFGRMDEVDVPVGVGRYQEPRLWYASDDYAESKGDFPERRTVHMAIDLFLRPGAALLAPMSATVHSFRNNDQRLDYGPTIILEHSPEGGPTFWTLYGHLTEDSLEGISAGTPVAKGDEFARIGDYPTNGDWPAHVHFQLITDLLGLEGNFPGVALPSQKSVWGSLSPDPGLMVDLPAGSTYQPRNNSSSLLEARRRRIGPSLSVSYGDEPLHIVRGWRQLLFSEDGQAWLDCVNNVCHVGHSHPRVVEAASRQMTVLNTNTRYLHANLVEFAARLAATLPNPLEVCFFTNSGSEANELALRLARTYTGREDLVVLDHAYHGNTGAAIEASPYKFDGSGGTGRHERIHVAAMPDVYRGRFRDDRSHNGQGPQGAQGDGPDPKAPQDPATLYAAEVGKALARAAERSGAAAFMHESLLSCGGQIEPPYGYLPEVYTRTREAGALCIADEVQVGFGRVGTHFWGFETQSVVPDIVTMGKPIGNGHPLGAVVTTREVAEAFNNGMEYFNTFGGNPVSCATGLAVLDVIREEGLQAHALEVGAHLKSGLKTLMAAHPLVGDVRGRGLFLGIEFATPGRDPLPELADYLVRRMKHHGVLLSTDGPAHNVIKIKPPMVFTAADADRLVGTMVRLLDEDFARGF